MVVGLDAVAHVVAADDVAVDVAVVAAVVVSERDAEPVADDVAVTAPERGVGGRVVASAVEDAGAGPTRAETEDAEKVKSQNYFFQKVTRLNDIQEKKRLPSVTC